MMSVGPPGGKGTISLTGRLGYVSWAQAVVESAAADAAAMKSRRFMEISTKGKDRRRSDGAPVSMRHTKRTDTLPMPCTRSVTLSPACTATASVMPPDSTRLPAGRLWPRRPR